MIKLINPTGWYLDDNGVNIMTSDERHVVDLHNECVIEEVVTNKDQLSLRFIKDADYTNSDLIKVGAKFNLIIRGIGNVKLPNFNYPETFEGIYDYKGVSLNLCIGTDVCYLVTGRALELEIQ